jgi:hypothetical protein
MAWTQPDYGATTALKHRSVPFKVYFDALRDGLAGIDCVLSGLALTGGADMTPAIAKGAVLSNRVMFAVAAADVTITAAHATLPRIDLIVVTSAGALAVRTGTAAANPVPPTPTANDVLLWRVYVAAAVTAIATADCDDMRVAPPFPVVVYRTTTAEVTNTTASAIHMLNKAGSGVVIPNGLFLAGRMLRVRICGNLLINSGTPTLTLAITYGGTTMFSDVSGATAADADRRPFCLDFMLVAQANNDQALTGHMQKSDVLAAITGPTTGIGDAWPGAATQEADAAFGGSAAIDSDAANRTLTTEFTFSVSNAANELVVEGATVELL